MKTLPSICFVAPNAYPILAEKIPMKIVGGAELQQCVIARALGRRKYSVSMICQDFGQPADLIIDGVRVLKAHKSDEGIPVLRFFHPRITSFWRAMKKADADIYYQRCASIHTSLVSFFCRQAGKKMIFSIASDSDLIPGQQLIKYKRDKLIYEWGLKHADVIIAQSYKQQELCKKNYNKNSICIRSCYELSSSNIVKNKGIDVLWVGTIKSIKRPEIFIELAQRIPELRFRMVGGSFNGNEFESYYCNIKEQAAKVSNLEFVGFVPYADIDKHFNETSLFVNTSALEGFPNTFLQSWARGIPTVSFIDPNAVVEGKQVGVVVDSIDEFVFKIRDLMGSPEQYKRIGVVCKRYVVEFHSLEKIIDEYTEVFSALID